MREKQYNYYLNALLDFEGWDNVEWKKLGEVTSYEQPTRYLVTSTNYSDDFVIPVLTAGKTFILGYTDEINGVYKASEKPVVIFDDFTTANKWVDFDFKVKSSAIKMITSKDETVVFLKFIYYWLNTLTRRQNDNDHNRQWLSNFINEKFPLPPLPIQAEIVRILDQFDNMINSISEGLPRLIELSNKQYQYYRDYLLSFDKE